MMWRNTIKSIVDSMFDGMSRSVYVESDAYCTEKLLH